MPRSYHPSLLIMAKELGFGYLDHTKILGTDQGVVAHATAADTGEAPPQEQELLRILDELIPGKKPRKELRETQRPFAYQTEGYRNLETVWDYSTAADIETYRDWYHQANMDCQALVRDLSAEIKHIDPPDPLRMVIGVVAATSQGTLWEKNLAVARELIRSRDLSMFTLKDTDGPPEDTDTEPEDTTKEKLFITKPNIDKVQRILNGDFSVLETDKFGAFFESILDPTLTQNTVVVDTHAAGIWLGERLGVQNPFFQKNKPEGARLAAIVRDYRKLAAKVNYSAQSIQAITWSVWRKLPPRYRTEYMRYIEGPHPEVEMFKALYPFLYSALSREGKINKKSTWRWRYKLNNELMRPEGLDDAAWKTIQQHYRDLRPHHTPAQWLKAVERYGSELWRYYKFPQYAWDAFLAKYPEFGQQLDRIRQASTASLLSQAAQRIGLY